VTRLQTVQPGFDSRQGQWRVSSFFSTSSRPARKPTQPPVQWVVGAVSPGVQKLWREADHSRPSSAEVKNAWSYTSTPLIMASYLVKHRDNCTFTFTLPNGFRWNLGLGVVHEALWGKFPCFIRFRPNSSGRSQFMLSNDCLNTCIRMT
jgi:hypothetical protein